jgi:hypothetical protein
MQKHTKSKHRVACMREKKNFSISQSLGTNIFVFAIHVPLDASFSTQVVIGPSNKFATFATMPPSKLIPPTTSMVV